MDDGRQRIAEPRRDDNQGIRQPSMHDFEFEQTVLRDMTRRTFFKQIGYGIGGLALSSLLADSPLAQTMSQDPMAAKKPHFPAKAKNVIFLFMAGAPSQVDLFDYKPTLMKVFEGRAVCVYQGDAQAFGFTVQVRTGWAIGAVGLRIASAL